MNFLKILFIGLIFGLSASLAVADQWVNGYTRSDGTYVQGHYRSDPNGTVRDNFSYKGNTNPYTGETGTNRYRNDPSSEYYNGGFNSGTKNSFGNSYNNSFNNGMNNRQRNQNSFGWD